MASVDSVYKILFFLLLFGWKVHFYYDNGLMFSHSFKFRGILPIDNLRLRWISWASAVAILLRFPFLWHVSIQYRCKGKIGTHGAKNDAAETCWIWFECFSFCSIVCFSLNVRYKLCDDNPLTPERSGKVNELGIFGKEFTKWLTTRCRRMWNMNSCVEFAGALLLLLYLFCAPCCWSCVRVCVYALFWVGCMD